MVDFGSVNHYDKTTVPAYQLVKVVILQRRNDVIEAFEDYYKKKFNNYVVGLAVVKARLKSLFLEVRALLKHRLKNESFEELQKLVNSDDLYSLERAFMIVDDVLYQVRLTSIDDKVRVTSGVAEADNKLHGV